MTKAIHPKIAFLRFSALQRPIRAAKFFSFTLVTDGSFGVNRTLRAGAFTRLALLRSPGSGVVSPHCGKEQRQAVNVVRTADDARPPSRDPVGRATERGMRT